jgi:ribosomal protein S18 acetylase RimI-like enzyme
MIIAGHSGDQLPEVRTLLTEYAGSVGFDLCFQDFDRELRELPGGYAPPTGSLLLAVGEYGAEGCVALRRLDGQTSEMKRLYVQPRARGSGLGRRLALAIMAEARRIGYARMRLDTVPSMNEAIGLYESLGFRRIAPYRSNPIAGALFMELNLGESSAGGGSLGP